MLQSFNSNKQLQTKARPWYAFFGRNKSSTQTWSWRARWLDFCQRESHPGSHNKSIGEWVWTHFSVFWHCFLTTVLLSIMYLFALLASSCNCSPALCLMMRPLGGEVLGGALYGMASAMAIVAFTSQGTTVDVWWRGCAGCLGSDFQRQDAESRRGKGKKPSNAWGALEYKSINRTSVLFQRGKELGSHTPSIRHWLKASWEVHKPLWDSGSLPFGKVVPTAVATLKRNYRYEQNSQKLGRGRNQGTESLWKGFKGIWEEEYSCLWLGVPRVLCPCGRSWGGGTPPHSLRASVCIRKSTHRANKPYIF